LKLNTPPPFVDHFFLAFDGADDAGSSLGLSLAEDVVGSFPALSTDDGERLGPKGRKQWPLSFFKGIDDHPAVLFFLHEFHAVGTANEEGQEGEHDRRSDS
jgi:hypothetical protein